MRCGEAEPWRERNRRRALLAGRLNDWRPKEMPRRHAVASSLALSISVTVAGSLRHVIAEMLALTVEESRAADVAATCT